MEKITYGAPRLVDWVAQIKAGAATVRVHFTGGALTSYGVTPAEYTTSNPFMQRVIEQSSHFKEGRITLLRRTPIAEPAKSIKPKAQRQATAKHTDPESAPAVPSKPQPTEPQPTEPPTPEETIEASPSTEPSQETEDVSEIGEETDSNLQQVSVSCIQDAQAYLQEKFNIPSYKVRTRPTAQKAAAEHGVMFVGGGFTAIGEETDSDTDSTEE